MRIFFMISTLILLSGQTLRGQTDYMQQWPQFRGPFASGIMENVDLPERWNINTGENIVWKTDIPGLGHSCPVVWDDKLFVVNGILTGTGIEGNVVWYNDDQNLGIRLGTIPVEDTVYAFSMILMNLFLFDFFKKKAANKKNNYRR